MAASQRRVKNQIGARLLRRVARSIASNASSRQLKEQRDFRIQHIREQSIAKGDQHNEARCPDASRDLTSHDANEIPMFIGMTKCEALR
jgi:hypothetical protein